MNTQLLIGLLLTITPLIELRLGLPIVIDYCLKNNLSIGLYSTIVISLNILLILAIFLFMDLFHKTFLKIPLYEKVFGSSISKIQKKAEKVKEGKFNSRFIALAIFVAIPLPGTGAWTGTLIAWLLGLNRIKSFIAIALGVIIAGIIILFGSLGLFSFFY